MGNTHALSSHNTRIRTRSRSGRSAARRQRGLSGIEIAVLLAIAAALVYGVFATASRPAAAGSQSRVRVEQGESLWAIAQAHPMPGQTTAQVADAIAEMNGMRDSRVAAGQYLMVPAAQEEVALAAR